MRNLTYEDGTRAEKVNNMYCYTIGCYTKLIQWLGYLMIYFSAHSWRTTGGISTSRAGAGITLVKCHRDNVKDASKTSISATGSGMSPALCM